MKTATYPRHNEKGESVWDIKVEYDETAPCRICGKPVIEASMGGTDVCPWCDCGNHRDGTKWTLEDAMRLIGMK